MMPPTMKSPLQVAREGANLTQAQLADRCKVAQSVISRIERGRMKATPQLAETIAKLLPVTELQVLYPERFTVAPRRKRAA